jgi:hypothetical protein
VNVLPRDSASRWQRSSPSTAAVSAKLTAERSMRTSSWVSSSTDTSSLGIVATVSTSSSPDGERTRVWSAVRITTRNDRWSPLPP